MAPKIFGILFIVFALGLALYFYRLDPLQKLGVDNFRFPKIFSTSTGIQESPPYFEERPPTYLIAEPTTTLNINPSDIPQGFTIGQLSPYFGKIQVGSLYQDQGTPESYGQLSIYSYADTDKQINVTGWVLKTNKGNTMVIPGGLEFYNSVILQSDSDIALRSGDVLNIYGTTNPTGRNFRLNKCIGYLEDVYDFTPSLPQYCPYIDRAELYRFSGECQDYISSLGSCQIPDSNPEGIRFDDYACRDYLRNLNYRGCSVRYQNDSDFFSQEWRVWVKKELFLDADRRHDRILLFDRQGLLVDEYTY